MNRHFFRCKDCLSVIAIDSAAYEYQFLGDITDAPCPICEGPTEYMGRVERGRAVKDEEECPCDARCTSAKGPNCECSCGGENHGSNRLVTVVRDKGPVRFSTVEDEVALARATEYRAARDAAKARFRKEFADEIGARERGEFVGSSRFYEMRSQRYVLNKAASGKTHKARMKALNNLLPEVEV